MFWFQRSGVTGEVPVRAVCVVKSRSTISAVSLLLLLVPVLMVLGSPGAAASQTPAAEPGTVVLRSPLPRPERPAGESEVLWQLARSKPKPEFGLDRDPSFRIHQLLGAWTEAWANKRVSEYLGFYSSRFEPADGVSLGQWQDQRRQRLVAPGTIRIEISGVQATLQPSAAELRAQVRFRQAYTSSTYSDTVLKTLDLADEPAGWRIVRETFSP